MVQKKIKRYKPKKRFKTNVIKAIRRKNFLIPISFMAFAAFTFFIINTKTPILSKKIKNLSVFSSTIQKISINSDSLKVKREAMFLFSKYIGKEFDKRIEDEIKETLKNNFPYVSDIKTNFNFFLSKLNINIETEKAIAYLTPINKYLLESGRFSEKSENDDFMTIECNECIIDKKNLKIINKFKETKEFPLPDCKIIIEKQTFNLVCGNIVIEWGDEKYFENKLEKLKYVIEDARNKFGDYFKIDLKFFSNGKIIVSKIKANESK
jgi:membrane-associated HD superfamily phosphohydrolase